MQAQRHSQMWYFMINRVSTALVASDSAGAAPEQRQLLAHEVHGVRDGVEHKVGALAVSARAALRRRARRRKARQRAAQLLDVRRHTLQFVIRNRIECKQNAKMKKL